MAPVVDPLGLSEMTWDYVLMSLHTRAVHDSIMRFNFVSLAATSGPVASRDHHHRTHTHTPVSQRFVILKECLV